ncbi:hypothetical protein AYO44_13055 [Planctomycetaceae bacterium SCGC AG-212-F19]|nr:hypothetical protein AYO44_13055 [Planctomycetaceae bacterium SCGC AG-212-F19]
MRSPLFAFVVVVGIAALAEGEASAGSRTLKPGERWGIAEDFVLSGEDVLEINGTAEKPCRVDGNGNGFKTSGKWTGRIKITHCEIRGLGSATRPVFDLTASGDGDQVVIEHCDFHACGAIHIANAEKSSTSFRHNHIRDTAMVPVTNLPDQSSPIFRASGDSSARKLFQGNRVDKSIVVFERARNWLVGGDSDADSNIITGLRGSLSIYTCADMTVRGNYIHTEIPSFRWSQVHTLAVLAPCPALVVEHNIIRHGQWVVRGLTGEFRYNLVLDADAHNFIIGPRAKCHIHHNILARYCTIDPNLNATIGVIYKADDIQVYNNTFDGGGKDMERPWHVPAIEVNAEGFLHSLRNNVFYNHATKVANGTATVRPGISEKTTNPGPARLGYADYNLFFNPDAVEKKNYAVSVAGKSERADAGFAKHDLPAGGAKDAQVEPKFKGAISQRFPFSDEDIKARKVPVSKILGFYRDVYSPAEGSPLLGAGDPADGAGSFIGAVGPGKNAPKDEFGRFGASRP